MSSTTRMKCHYCDKVCRSALGIRRHLQTCRAVFEQSYRTVAHTSAFRTDLSSRASGFGGDSSQSHFDGQAGIEPVAFPSTNAPPADDLPFRAEEDIAAHSPGNDVARSYPSGETSEWVDISDDDVDAEATSTAPTSIRQGRRIKTTVATKICYSDPSIAGRDLFGKGAGRPAGKPLDRPTDVFLKTALGRAKLRKDNGLFTGLIDQDYSPFESAFDYTFAGWLLSSKLSKGAIDSLLRDHHLRPLSDCLSFRNAEELLQRVNNIHYGIPGLVDEEWSRTALEIPSEYEGEIIHCEIFYRSVEDVIRFLIGFPPFSEHLRYAPEQHFDDEGHRVYTEMYTANWWWRTQHLLDAPNATIIPVLIASDKTQLSSHHGDQKVWAVYLTIGNLDRAARLKYSLPSLILVGLLPIVPQLSSSHDGLKMELYHRAMDIIFRPLKRLARDGVVMTCADGLDRMCFPIIAGFLADYEEQVMMTCIKMNQQCPICYVPRDQREHLYPLEPWPLRLQPRTLEMIQKQADGEAFQSLQFRDEDLSFWHRDMSESHTAKPRRGYSYALDEKEENNHVHAVRNFVWGHRFADVHQSILPDILHQVLKGLVMMLVSNIKSAVQGSASVITTARKRAHQRRTLAQATAKELLDRRFKAVPAFSGLRRFPLFSNVSQWTGDEQRAIVRQIVPVITPLFRQSKPEYILLARAVVDFYLLANSPVHTEGILRYIEDAIYRIDLLKWSYNTERMKESRTADEPHYNIPKLHQITHYTEQIRQFGSVDGFSTNRSEVGHKDEIKAFYPRTNKNDYLPQLVRHNTRRVKWMAMSSYTEWLQSNKETQAERQMDRFEGASPCQKLVDLSKLGVRFSMSHVDLAPKPHKFWARVADLMPILDVPDLIAAVGTFVRQQRDQRRGVSLTNLELDRYDTQTNWASQLWVSLHNRIRCPKPAGKNPFNMDETTDDWVHASLRYRGKDSQTRRDHVWVQEFQPLESQAVVTDAQSTPTNTTEPTSQRNKRKRVYSASVTTTEVHSNGQPTITTNTTTATKQFRKSQVRAQPTQAHHTSTAPANAGDTRLQSKALILDGRRIGQVLAIMTIEDPSCKAEDTNQFVRYTAILIELLHFRHGGRYDPVHGMIEVQQYLPTESPTIAKRRFYTLDTVLRSAHVIPGQPMSAEQRQVSLVNPYIDWDQYNTLYNPDFLEENRRVAEEMFTKKRWERFVGRHKPVYRRLEPWISGPSPA